MRWERRELYASRDADQAKRGTKTRAHGSRARGWEGQRFEKYFDLTNRQQDMHGPSTAFQHRSAASGSLALATTYNKDTT
jgi:hypothetical protein